MALDGMKQLRQETCNEAPERFPVESQGYREKAQRILEQAIRRQHGKAEALEILMKVIPWDLLNAHDDEILWGWFCELRA